MLLPVPRLFPSGGPDGDEPALKAFREAGAEGSVGPQSASRTYQ